MYELKGNIVRKVFVGEGEGHMDFVCDDHIWRFEVDGDCCSESWFSDVYNFGALIDSEVRSVSEVDMPSYNTEDGKCRQESDQVYGFEIYTGKGVATVVFRNSSNGYYGGSCKEGQMVRVAEGKEITGDWSSDGGVK